MAAMTAGVEWFNDFAFMYCREQHDANTFNVIREATARSFG